MQADAMKKAPLAIAPSGEQRETTPPSAAANTQGLSRTRLRTRKKLIDAALAVMGQKGVEGTSIAEITGAADVGFGSFYSNFRTLEELASEVFVVRAEVLARQLASINEQVEDPALAASFIQRWFIETAVHDRVWGWFLIHADATLQQFERTFGNRVRADIAHGVKCGRFTVRSIEAAATITLASLVAVMRRILEGTSKPSLACEMVELLLRQYGIEAEEARRLSRVRLPNWISKPS
jgi:AcrR family transcriptional regulator